MIKGKIKLDEILIRNNFTTGDQEEILNFHWLLYSEEYGWGIEFRNYVESGLKEFALNYKVDRSCVWICVHENNLAGCLFLIDRNNSAQLRLFLIKPEYRGIGLGRKLMELFMEKLRECKFSSAYLWTTNEQETAAVLYKKYGFELTEELQSKKVGKKIIEQRYDLKLN